MNYGFKDDDTDDDMRANQSAQSRKIRTGRCFNSLVTKYLQTRMRFSA